jgi:hypothetical protein
MKIVISISKEKDMLGSYDENSLREIILSDDVVKLFDEKYRSIGYESSLEEFISRDISDLIKNEIDDGLYGLFNY